MLLAIDTSTRSVGVALYDGVQVVSERVWLSQQFHTVELAPTVSSLIDQAGTSLDELKVVAVALGPGSFTGLRIGMAFAKGMALAGHLDLVGIPSLDILAASHAVDDRPLAAMLEAGRGRIAVGWYKNYSGEWKADKKIQVMTPKELASGIKSPTIVCGELSEADRRTEASDFARRREIRA